MDNKKMMHIGIKKGEVGKYVFLPGSPERTEKIAKYFDNAKEIAFNREYRTFIGTLDGELVAVTSTGIGGPSAAIAIEELSAIGVDTMIRIGTCASMSPKVKKGDIVVPSGAVKMEGTSSHYLPVEFPAVPNFEILKILTNSLDSQKIKYHTDVSITKDSFYSQTNPERSPVSNTLIRKWDEYIRGGATTTSMECSILFAVGAALGIRTASMLVSATNAKSFEGQEPGDSYDLEDYVIRAGIEGMRQIIKSDKNSKF
ncbi:nucleoside phosphorylase [Miniphocaeibacter halophilus]|uniref:Nucleoside phosphorylase n=1 Tax=Miniphocaeibacter halophilus TaxID=2931922 RepID=A0AC61MP24_9FIRM|nr:nucleoside phosphorylase [Miniphocaeibacter halophilus]QQK07254.1 nucleoside phosphorylase [Miniphocaeibacter halophilus]